VDGAHQIVLLSLLLVIISISTSIITKFFVLPSPQGATTVAAAALYWFHKVKKEAPFPREYKQLEKMNIIINKHTCG
jgi:hypothetical protein